MIFALVGLPNASNSPFTTTLLESDTPAVLMTDRSWNRLLVAPGNEKLTDWAAVPLNTVRYEPEGAKFVRELVSDVKLPNRFSVPAVRSPDVLPPLNVALPITARSPDEFCIFNNPPEVVLKFPSTATAALAMSRVPPDIVRFPLIVAADGTEAVPVITTF